MLNIAYKIGEDAALQDAAGSKDPEVIRSLVEALSGIESPRAIKSPTTRGGGYSTNYSTNVSWGPKNDLSIPVG